LISAAHRRARGTLPPSGTAPEEPWGIKDRQLWEYIRRADKLCQELIDAKADHLISRHLLQRRKLFGHTMDVGDYRTALAILQDEAKLEALYPAEKHEHRGKLRLDATVNATDDQRRQALVWEKPLLPNTAITPEPHMIAPRWAWKRFAQTCSAA
jgi:hypothetical protein